MEHMPVYTFFSDALKRVFQLIAKSKMAKTGCQGSTAYHFHLFVTHVFYSQLPAKHILDNSLPLPFNLTCTLNLHRMQEECVKLKKVVGAGAKHEQTKHDEELEKKFVASEAKDCDSGAFIGPLCIELKMGPAETLQRLRMRTMCLL
ncbi:hypothetical protein BDR03DRAFT_1093976 [Suillus americanus]|nr:hypothetical protein BDR03DRAFT_1093976 [Suillus americanus]